MNTAKILASLALVAAPLSTVAAQSATQPDSGTHGSRAGKWVAGTGAVAGAALFLAFTQGHASSSSPALPLHQPGTTPAAPSLPTAGLSPKDGTTQTDTTTTVTDSALTPPPNQAPVEGPTVPSQPGDNSFTPGNDEPPFFNDEPPQLNLDAALRNDAPVFVPASSTVPEPGSLALTATGIVGLLPLVRRRRK